MMRVKQLGTVQFERNSLFVKEDFSPRNIDAEMHPSAAGTHIVFVADIHTPYITLESQKYGWIDDSQKAAIEAMWADYGTDQTIIYDDNSSETVRMAVEKQLQFTPLYEGAKKYTAVIPLAKV